MSLCEEERIRLPVAHHHHHQFHCLRKNKCFLLPDVRASCWNSLVFAAALNKMVVNTASTFETMQEGDENYAETATLLENMTKMRAAFDVKARIGIDVVGAYAAVPWFESFSESESVE